MFEVHNYRNPSRKRREGFWSAISIDDYRQENDPIEGEKIDVRPSNQEIEQRKEEIWEHQKSKTKLIIPRSISSRFCAGATGCCSLLCWTHLIFISKGKHKSVCVLCTIYPLPTRHRKHLEVWIRQSLAKKERLNLIQPRQSVTVALTIWVYRRLWENGWQTREGLYI
jgi:hypothetical protein